MVQSARCKFQCQKVEEIGCSQTVSMQAYYDEPLTKEDEAFSTSTPSGTMSFYIYNPNLNGFFQEGKFYYIDITPAAP